MRTAPAGHPDPARREPLWDRVDSNRIALAAYVALFVVAATASFDLLVLPAAFLLSLAVASVLGWEELLFVLGHPGLIWMVASAALAVAAFVWALYALSRCEGWLVRRLGAKLAPTGELIDTKMALKDMAIASGHLIAPALYVIETRSVNAFIFSAHRRRAVVGVTSGMVERLTIDEQRAVFANLMARMVAGDTVVATGVTSILWPMYAWRELTRRRHNERIDDPFGISDHATGVAAAWLLVVPFVLFGFAFAIVGELLVAGHRRKQLRTAEKADAEGMLLLKDPATMLSALEKSVRYDNLVPSAGEALTGLFYCWTGLSTNDDADPEWHRVARLREVLGVEGVVQEMPVADSPVMAAAPLPPRLG